MPLSLKIKDIMSKSIVSVKASDPVWDAVELMYRHDIGGVLAKEGEEYVGILTERDIMKKVTLRELPPRSAKVSEVMSTPLITVQADESLGEASLKMLQNKIRRLGVVSGERVVGVVTERDLSRATLDIMLSLSRV